MARPRKKQKTDANSQIVPKQTQVQQASGSTGSNQTKTYEIPLSPLPAEIIDLIISYLNAEDIFHLRKVNKSFKYYLDDNHIEKLNKILWGYTFAEFQALNKTDFLPTEQRSIEDEQQQPSINSKFSVLLEKYNNITDCVDFFVKNLAHHKEAISTILSSTIIDNKIQSKLINFCRALYLLLLTSSIEEIKNYIAKHNDLFKQLDIELLSFLSCSAILRNPNTVGILLTSEQSTNGTLLLKIITGTKVKFRSTSLQKFIIEASKNSELKNTHTILAALITNKAITENLYYILSNNISLLSKEETVLFEFIKTGIETESIANYIASHAKLQNLQGIYLRGAILEKFVAQLFYRENYYFIEQYRKEHNITVVDIAKLYYKYPFNISGQTLVQFIKRLIETQDTNFFKHFSKDDNIIALILKKIQTESSGATLSTEILKAAIEYKCYEYIEIFIAAHGNYLLHAFNGQDNLYQAALVAYERNKLPEFFKLVLVHCSGLAHIVLVVAAEKNIIIPNITNRKIINSYFQGKTPLHYAAATGHVDVVRHLIKNGADITALATVGYFKYPAWYLALMNNHTVLAEYLLGLSDNEDKLIFQAIISTDTVETSHIHIHTLPTIDGITTLELISLLKCEEIITYLSQTYVLTDPKDLVVAVKYNNFPLVKHLVENNVDINIKIDAQTSLLNLAIENGYPDIAYYLLSKGAKINNQDFSYPILVTNKKLLLKLFAADENGNLGSTQDRGELLFKAYPDQDIHIELIARGFVNITLVKKNQLLYLLWRIAAGNEVISYTVPGRINSSLLIKYKNFKTPQGVTILSFAARVGNDSVIEYYCKSDANLNIFSEDPAHSPILIAAKKGNWRSVIQLLTNFFQQQDKDKYANYKNVLVDVMEIAKEPADKTKNNMFNTPKSLALKDIIDMIEEILYPEKNIAKEIQLHHFSKARTMLTSLFSTLTDNVAKNEILQLLWQEAKNQYDLIHESNQPELVKLLNFIAQEQEIYNSPEAVFASSSLDSDSDSDSSSNTDDSSNDSSDDDELLVNNPYLGSGLNFNKGKKRQLEQGNSEDEHATKIIKR